MTDKTPRTPVSPETIAGLVGTTVKPGSNVSFNLQDGTVNVNLDQSGDWTIMVGLSVRTERLTSIMFSLESLGFFRATENDGTLYMIWTSALEEGGDSRSLVEATLFKTLTAFHRGRVTSYIS